MGLTIPGGELIAAHWMWTVSSCSALTVEPRTDVPRGTRPFSLQRQVVTSGQRMPGRYNLRLAIARSCHGWSYRHQAGGSGRQACQRAPNTGATGSRRHRGCPQQHPAIAGQKELPVLAAPRCGSRLPAGRPVQNTGARSWIRQFAGGKDSCSTAHAALCRKADPGHQDSRALPPGCRRWAFSAR